MSRFVHLSILLSHSTFKWGCFRPQVLQTIRVKCPGLQLEGPTNFLAAQVKKVKHRPKYVYSIAGIDMRVAPAYSRRASGSRIHNIVKMMFRRTFSAQLLFLVLSQPVCGASPE